MTDPADDLPADAIREILDRLCRAFAFAGGTVLVGITLMSVYSIVMRYFFGKPIAGDFELVQLACAACVAAFLPITQLRGGNIVVDFFTDWAGRRATDVLDGFGALLVALVMAVLAWRTTLGSLGVKSSGETSMIMGFPVWYSYALMVPGFALTAVVALFCAVRRWQGRAP